MKVKRVESSIEMRINLGNFEGISNPNKITADLDEGDDVQACIAELYKMSSQAWAKEVLRKLRFYRAKCVDNTKISLEIDKAIPELKKMALGE